MTRCDLLCVAIRNLRRFMAEYFLMKKYEKSLMDIKVTLTLEPRHFGALSGMGLIFMNRGDFQRALMAFTAVLKIYPFSISAAANMKIIERELNLKVL